MKSFIKILMAVSFIVIGLAPFTACNNGDAEPECICSTPKDNDPKDCYCDYCKAPMRASFDCNNVEIIVKSATKDTAAKQYQPVVNDPVKQELAKK